jgi:transposase
VSALADPLPDDIEALRALVRNTRAECDRLAEQNEKLWHLLRQLERAQFGRSSEKLDPDQLQLALEDIEQAVARVEAADEKRDAALQTARTRLDQLHLSSLSVRL